MASTTSGDGNYAVSPNNATDLDLTENADKLPASGSGKALLMDGTATQWPGAIFDPSVSLSAFRLNIRAPFDPCENFWWLEIGGDGDSLNKAEEYNRELIACAFGAWDYIKNSGKFRCENRELDWVGFLAGKRESRRYIGDYTLTQNDVEQATPFEDEVAYGGWSMDDHDPRGLFAEGAPNVQHPIRAPYPIPYRCLSSANVKNLFFAGRNISVTHI